MVDNPRVVPIWMAVVEDAVAKFKDRSVEEQEVICQRLAEKYKNEEVGAKARELFKAGRPKQAVVNWRRDGGYKPAGGPKPKPEPEPQEPAEEEEPKKAAVGDVGVGVGFAGEQAKQDDGGPVLVSKSSPYDTAKEFVRRHWIKDGMLATYWWDEGWWKWNGCCYKQVAGDRINSEAWAFLDGARVGALSVAVDAYSVRLRL